MQILGRIYSTARYNSLVERDQARVIYGISTVMVILVTLLLLVVRGSNGRPIIELVGTQGILTTTVSAFYLLIVTGFLLTRLGHLRVASLGMVLMWALSFGALSASGGTYTTSTGIALVIQILLGGLLLNQAGLLIGVGLALATLFFGLQSRATAPLPNYNSPAELIVVVTLVAIFSGIVYLYLRFSRLSREDLTGRALAERLKLSEITSLIAQRISSRNSLNEVLNNAIDQIVENYPDIYHAQVFLIDNTGQTAQLVASTGEAGQKLLALKHSLGVGSQSVIGTVTGKRQSVVARANLLNTVHRRNEYLPDTQVEAAFPLLIGDRVIGALDLQSRENGAFSSDQMPIFQTLADHIAISIDNALLFEESESRVEDNRKLVDQTRAALREVERLNMRLTGRAWSDFLQNTHQMQGLSMDFDQNLSEPQLSWTDSLQHALRDNQVIREDENGHKIVAVPLRVRGQAIGAMEFELDDKGQLSEEDLEMVEQIGERFGMAIETARLYQESQRSAQREALINEISTKLQASNNVETTLNEAARSLQRTLKANKVSIRLGPPPGDNRRKDGQA